MYLRLLKALTCVLRCVPQQVKIIVQNALRLYSQDRTGLVDYALESGGKNKVSQHCLSFSNVHLFYTMQCRS